MPLTLGQRFAALLTARGLPHGGGKPHVGFAKFAMWIGVAGNGNQQTSKQKKKRKFFCKKGVETGTSRHCLGIWYGITNKEKEVRQMGFDQKAMKLLGKKVEVKTFNGYIIKGTMSHVSKGYVCFITTDKRANDELTSFRRLSLRDVTSMVCLEN